MESKKDRIVQGSIVSIFVLLYFFTSIISTIHVVDFFQMTNPRWLSVALAIAFEFGAAASLAAIVVGKKTNEYLVWGLFIILTLFQMQGNMWYAYVNANDYISWIELFGLIEEEIIFQKRILAGVSGAVLPIVALGFIKSLVDYIKPTEENETVITDTSIIDDKTIENETIDDELKIDASNAKISVIDDTSDKKPIESLNEYKERVEEIPSESTEEIISKDKNISLDEDKYINNIEEDVEISSDPVKTEIELDKKTFGKSLKIIDEENTKNENLDQGLQQKKAPSKNSSAGTAQ